MLPAMPRMTAADIERFLTEEFPQVEGFTRIEDVGEDTVRLRLPYRDAFLRPGGTLSGPTLMTLADTAMYFLVLAQVGPVALAVTTNLTIHFLRRPAPRDLIAEARLLRLGGRSAVGDVVMRSDGDPAPVAHATVAYALPPPGGAPATSA
jgi:uncharacterized protein (TIGR00369 family)